MDDYVSKPVPPEDTGRKPPSVASLRPAPAARESRGGRPGRRSTTRRSANLRLLQSPGEPDFRHRAHRPVCADIPERFADLERAVHAGDAHAVDLIAHTLKSSAANLGLMRLSHGCAATSTAHARDPPRNAQAVGDLRREFDRVKPPLLVQRQPADGRAAEVA